MVVSSLFSYTFLVCGYSFFFFIPSSLEETLVRPVVRVVGGFFIVRFLCIVVAEAKRFCGGSRLVNIILFGSYLLPMFCQGSFKQTLLP